MFQDNLYYFIKNTFMKIATSTIRNKNFHLFSEKNIATTISS